MALLSGIKFRLRPSCEEIVDCFASSTVLSTLPPFSTMSRTTWGGLMDFILGQGSNVWKKLTKPTVPVGGTQWPKSASELERQGVRFDYDGTVTEDGQEFHRYQIQPNAGKIPSAWKRWRDEHGGTHAVIGTLKVKKDATMEEFREALEKFRENL